MRSAVWPAAGPAIIRAAVLVEMPAQMATLHRTLDRGERRERQIGEGRERARIRRVGRTENG
jgi:hypothetical protein